jgi:polar amino acid transport system substrate-binding protein
MENRWAALVAAWLTALIGLTPAIAAADTLDDVKKRGELIFGGDAEGGGPFVFPRQDDPTQMQGFEIELANLLAAKLGVKARFSQGQWGKLPDLLQRGDIDVVLNGYEWTPTLGQRYAASIPYYVYELQMLVRKNDDRFKQLKDLGTPGLDGKTRIAVLGGSAAERYLQHSFGDAVEIISYEGTTDAMRGVEQALDGVDATLQDLPIVTYYEARFPLLRRLGEPVEPGYYVILARPQDQRLIAALNQAILECYKDGSFPRVLARYGMWNDTQRHRGLVTDEQGNFRPDLPAAAGAQAGDAAAPQKQGLWVMLWQDGLGWILVQAAGVTVLLASLAMPLAIFVGLAIAVGRLYGPKFLRPPLGWYVEVVRGTPLVLQLYVIFFILPAWGVAIPAFWAAVFGLALNYSAYEAEIYRAGLQAIPRGQMEAALSLGMPRWLALRRIIIPQAMRLVIPPVMNDFIAMFKDTAVCSLITVVELSKAYYIHAQSTGAVVELGIVTAILYLAMSYPLSIFVSRMERRLAAGERT